jgi:predicted metal-dependent hydrolase
VTRHRKNDKPADDWQPLEDVVSKDIFKAEVQAWAVRIRVEPKELHVRAMSRKWGSCSTAGRVTFDSDLMSQPADFRKEVIVHELLHLKVPNHGKLFRALLRAYLGKTTAESLSKPKVVAKWAARRSRQLVED